MNRLQQLRHLEEKHEFKQKQLNAVSSEIDHALEKKLGSDLLIELCGKRNVLNTDLYYLARQIQNLKDRKCYLGEVVVEVNENGV
jgi:hypothetical protein